MKKKDEIISFNVNSEFNEWSEYSECSEYYTGIPFQCKALSAVHNV